jgi:uncharacterized membrane protein YtjA (UPF0391 family)
VELWRTLDTYGRVISIRTALKVRLITDNLAAERLPATATACFSAGTGPAPFTLRKGVAAMLYYALVFLIVGLIAGALGVYGVAGIASQIAWVLFLIGIIFLIIHLVSGTRRPIV